MAVRTVSIVVAAVIALAAVIGWDWSVFATIGTSMPVSGWVALVLGVGFTILVGGGLMFLVFYSSRHGYDDAVGRREPSDDSGDGGEEPGAR